MEQMWNCENVIDYTWLVFAYVVKKGDLTSANSSCWQKAPIEWYSNKDQPFLQVVLINHMCEKATSAKIESLLQEVYEQMRNSPEYSTKSVVVGKHFCCGREK